MTREGKDSVSVAISDQFYKIFQEAIPSATKWEKQIYWVKM